MTNRQRLKRNYTYLLLGAFLIGGIGISLEIGSRRVEPLIKEPVVEAKSIDTTEERKVTDYSGVYRNAKFIAHASEIVETVKSTAPEVKPQETQINETKGRSNTELEEMIYQIAESYGIDGAFVLHLAMVESGLRADAFRPASQNAAGGNDRGIVQWNSRWHPEITDECAYNPRCAIEEACKLIAIGGEGQWYATAKVNALGIYSGIN